MKVYVVTQYAKCLLVDVNDIDEIDDIDTFWPCESSAQSSHYDNGTQVRRSSAVFGYELLTITHAFESVLYQYRYRIIIRYLIYVSIGLHYLHTTMHN